MPVCGEDLLQRANNILLHQRNTGGWPKNYDRDAKLSQTERTQLKPDKAQTDSTIDNGATHREIRILAKSYHRLGNQQFQDAAVVWRFSANSNRLTLLEPQRHFEWKDR